MRTMNGKVRMADIAEKLGVSVVTVSKALAGKEGVGDALRARILDLAKQMEYVPLRVKPEEKAPRAESIGILLADRFFDAGSFYSRLYRQVVKCCGKHGYAALLELVSPEAERSCTLPAIVQGKKVDGIIFMGEISREYMRTVIRSELPYLLLDFYDDDMEADSITSDNVSGGYRLTTHLIQTGRTRIGFVGTRSATSSIMDRFLGYAKVLLRSDIPINKDWILDDRDENGTLIPIQLPEDMPQAFVCSYDEVAQNLIELLKKEGYRVPEDVAVVGYDDAPMAQSCSPRLTTYRVNTEGMGEMVVSQLIRRINGKHSTRGNIVVKGEFVRREST